MIKETLYLLALYRFQCFPHYINEPNNEVSSECVNVLELFRFFIYY